MGLLNYFYYKELCISMTTIIFVILKARVKNKIYY